MLNSPAPQGPLWHHPVVQGHEGVPFQPTVPWGTLEPPPYRLDAAFPNLPASPPKYTQTQNPLVGMGNHSLSAICGIEVPKSTANTKRDSLHLPPDIDPSTILDLEEESTGSFHHHGLPPNLYRRPQRSVWEAEYVVSLLRWEVEALKEKNAEFGKQNAELERRNAKLERLSAKLEKQSAPAAKEADEDWRKRFGEATKPAWVA